MVDGPVEGRGAIGLRLVGVGAGLEEFEDGGGVGAFGGVGERGLGIGGGGEGAGEEGEGEGLHGRRSLGEVDAVEEVFDFAGAVDEGVEVDADAVEQGEMEIGEVGGFFVAEVAAAFEPAGGAAGDEDGKVFVVVEAGVAHAAAVEVDGVVE
jgi:hypothetical protein